MITGAITECWHEKGICLPNKSALHRRVNMGRSIVNNASFGSLSICRSFEIRFRSRDCDGGHILTGCLVVVRHYEAVLGTFAVVKLSCQKVAPSKKTKDQKRLQKQDSEEQEKVSLIAIISTNPCLRTELLRDRVRRDSANLSLHTTCRRAPTTW